MNDIAAAARKARALYARCTQGVLSTVSQDVAGFPFGSVAPFATDRHGRPILLVSSIAEHTRNMKADPRVSLIVTEPGDDSQEGGRLTLVGSAREVPAAEEADLARRYFRRFPHAERYRKAHDFSFFVIEPSRLRYIGGFGQIHWLEPAAVCQPNPFDAQVEDRMASHMNQDHLEAMRDWCRWQGVPAAADPRMAAIDAEGCDVMVGKKLMRIDFEAPVTSADEVRKAMIALVGKARAASGAAA